MPSNPVTPSETLVAALKKLLRPLVRLLINHGITLPFLSRLLKDVYVDVAEQAFHLDGQRPTDSRVSLLTGVHRKDVRRLRAHTDQTTRIPPAVSMGAQLIATWISDRNYTDRDGAPKALPIRASGRQRYSFETLVTSVSRQDLRPRVVLDELLRLGLVTIDHDDVVRLETEAFVPAGGFDEKAHYFGQNLRDHIAAAAENLDESDSPWFERAVSYHGLSREDIDELRSMSESLAMEALKSINRRARQMKRRAENDDSANGRINFGAYFYAEDEASDTDDD